MSATTSANGAALRLSPLQDVHLELGAHLTEFAGWRLPLRFTSELEEHRAVREHCGLFDISHMGQLEVTGPDAADALAGALVGDFTKLATGAARYTMICNESGGVLDDLIVYRLTSDDFLVIANASNTEVVHEAFNARFAGRAAAVRDMTEERALLSLQGPQAVEMISSLLGESAELPSRFHVSTCEIASQPVLLARTGYTGEDGFELSVDRTGAEALWRCLALGSGEVAVTPVGLAARDTLRLEAGLPLYGHELNASRTPFEAGFGWTVDLDHEFVGMAALRNAKATGSIDRLIGLVSEGRRVPRDHYAVTDQEGARVGEVTSGAPSPTLGKPIAMAYVRRAVSVPGTSLLVDVRGRMEPTNVVTLPFWRRASS